jgi:hypothetical protein
MQNFRVYILNGQIIIEGRIGMDVRGSGRGIFSDTIPKLPIWTEKSTKNLSRDRKPPGRGSNRENPEYNKEELPFEITCSVNLT